MLVVKPHESLLKGPTLDASYSEMQAAYASARFDAPEHCHSTRDPHDLPDFSSSDPQTSPVLFLPPLLSSLPYGLSHTPAPSPDQPPVTTETHLPDIDPASLSLHKALHYFSPVTPQYAILPYAESFNWDSLKLPEDQEREWYIVAFRSKRRPGSDSGRESEAIPDQDWQMLTTFLELYEADRRAHEEAVQNGGVSFSLPLLPFISGKCLSTTSLSCTGMVRQTRRVITSLPAYGNPADTPSLPTLVLTTSLPLGSLQPRSSLSPSSGMLSGRSRGRQALLWNRIRVATSGGNGSVCWFPGVVHTPRRSYQ